MRGHVDYIYSDTSITKNKFALLKERYFTIEIQSITTKMLLQRNRQEKSTRNLILEVDKSIAVSRQMILSASSSKKGQL